MLPRTVAKGVVFFGANAYVPLFCRLTEGIERRTVFYNSKNPQPRRDVRLSATTRSRARTGTTSAPGGSSAKPAAD